MVDDQQTNTSTVRVESAYRPDGYNPTSDAGKLVLGALQYVAPKANSWAMGVLLLDKNENP